VFVFHIIQLLFHHRISLHSHVKFPFSFVLWHQYAEREKNLKVWWRVLRGDLGRW